MLKERLLKCLIILIQHQSSDKPLETTLQLPNLRTLAAYIALAVIVCYCRQLLLVTKGSACWRREGWAGKDYEQEEKMKEQVNGYRSGDRVTPTLTLPTSCPTIIMFSRVFLLNYLRHCHFCLLNQAANLTLAQILLFSVLLAMYLSSVSHLLYSRPSTNLS